NRELCDMFDVRVFLDPPEVLRRHWKVQRDCSRRGYTTDEVLAELDRREADSEAYVRPQRHHADIVVSFQPAAGADQEHLDCRLTLRDSLPHPDLADVVGEDGEDGVVLTEKPAGVQELYVPGRIPYERAHRIEEAIWTRMHFARHLREQRLGEFTIGTELHRSDSLAVVQLLILYHVVFARAAVAGGRASARELGLDELDELVSNAETVQLSVRSGGERPGVGAARLGDRAGGPRRRRLRRRLPPRPAPRRARARATRAPLTAPRARGRGPRRPCASTSGARPCCSGGRCRDGGSRSPRARRRGSRTRRPRGSRRT